MSAASATSETGSPGADRQGRPAASGVIWDWRGEAAASRKKRHRRRNRLHGCVQAVVGLAIATGLFLGLGWRVVPPVVAAISLLVLLLALLSPDKGYTALNRVFTLLGHFVGRGLTWLLLTPLFFLFFLPFGLLRRRGARDPLVRRLEAGAATYRSPRAEDAPSPERYTRQY